MGEAFRVTELEQLRCHVAALQELLDVHERTALQQAEKLEETVAEYRAVAATSLDGMVGIDPDGVVLMWNPQAERIFGWDAREALGRPLSGLIIPPEHRSAYEEALKRLRDGAPLRALQRKLELVALRRSGETFPVEVSLMEVRSGSGRKVVGFIADISERKAAEEAIRESHRNLRALNESLEQTTRTATEMAERAEQASLAKSQFLAGMSHEIRTPMNGVMGMLGLLLDTPLSGEQREFARTARASAESLLTIINDILDISKIESGKITIEPISFDLRVTVEEVADLLASEAERKGLTMAVRYDPRAPVRVVGDAGRIRQMLMNLTGNALKFTQTGHILISVDGSERQGDRCRVVISVEDTGIGIPESKLDHIFERFTQADASTTRRFGGTGLGLAIVRQLAGLMQGEVTVTSRPGEGSTFRLSLPLGLATDEAPEPPLDVELSGVRALVVDDNAVNRRIFCERLAQWSLRASEAATADEALEALRDAARAGDPFELALLDYEMPGKDGEQLAREIADDEAIRETLLILLTSVGRRGDAGRMASAGFAAYLVKPVRHALLREALVTVWGLRRQGRVHALITSHALSEAQAARARRGAASGLEAGSRALVVEDNAVNQLVARRVLERLGCRVDVAGNGREALEMLDRLPYDIVFMDCQMPEMDGFETTAAIRSRGGAQAGIPVVAMTAGAMAGDRERCVGAGMDDYLSKPVSAHDLEAKLRRWVAAGRAQRAKAVGRAAADPP